MFSPEERQQILDRLLSALQTDERIAGALVVGSGAVGFADAYSDIDLSVVVAAESDALPVFREWIGRIAALFPVVACSEVTYGAHNYLGVFLLDSFLELDIGFLCLTNLIAKRARWKVAFDHSGKIEEIMQSSLEKRSKPDIQSDYLSRVNSIWHYIIHVVVALKRGRPWMALHYLEVLRNRTVELAGLRTGLTTDHFRQVDQMPSQFLAELEQTLVSSTDAADIMHALKAAMACFFRAARELDQALGLEVSANLETKMQAYLDASRLEPK